MDRSFGHGHEPIATGSFKGRLARKPAGSIVKQSQTCTLGIFWFIVVPSHAFCFPFDCGCDGSGPEDYVVAGVANLRRSLERQLDHPRSERLDLLLEEVDRPVWQRLFDVPRCVRSGEEAFCRFAAAFWLHFFNLCFVQSRFGRD